MPTPQYEDVYEPPLLDATFIDKIDDLIAELQNLSAPSATNVAVSPTGMHYITEDDAQGALAELDAECYALNNSLTQLGDDVSSFGNYTLLNGESVSNTKTTKTLYSGRKLSDYKIYMAVIKVSEAVRTCFTVPSQQFQSGRKLSLFYVDSVNTQRWFEISYKSDTTVDIQSSTNVANDTTVWLYGVKF